MVLMVVIYVSIIWILSRLVMICLCLCGGLVDYLCSVIVLMLFLVKLAVSVMRVMIV